jgi:hypothetical protein
MAPTVRTACDSEEWAGIQYRSSPMADVDRPSTLMMVANIGGTTLVMAGVVFMVAGAELIPGIVLLVAGLAVLVGAKRLRPKVASSGSRQG